MSLVARAAVAGDHQGLGFLAAGTGRGRRTEQGDAADLRFLFVIPVHVDEAVVFHKLILFLSGKTWFDDGLWPIARLDETVVFCTYRSLTGGGARICGKSRLFGLVEEVLACVLEKLKVEERYLSL